VAHPKLAELSRAQKRAQATCGSQALRTKQRFADFNPQELTAAQVENELKSVWESAEAEEDGYLIEGGILHRRSTDACGEVVVPK
jgi:hypothetical protein